MTKTLTLIDGEFSVYLNMNTHEVVQKEPQGTIRSVRLRKNSVGRTYFDVWKLVKSDITGKYIFDTSVRKRFFYSRILAEVYIQNPYNYRFVEHYDGNLDNFAISNLYWSKVQQSYLRKIKVNGVEVY